MAGLLLAIVFAACGGGGGGGSGPPPTQNPVPVLTSISPTGANAGDPAFTLTVTGSNFISSSKVRWGGSDRTTTFVSASQLTAAISASDVAAGASVNVTVFNPTPGGGTSSPQTFTITNLAPTLTGISPTSTSAGGPDFSLTVNGTHFVSNSVVRWGGSDRTTTFVSATRLTATIPASDIAAVGSASVTVFNPAPGGGTSKAATFTISKPSPVSVLTSSLPATTGGRDYNFTLVATGGIPPYLWSNSAGALPSGLTLDATSGQISGTVTGTGADTIATFTVRAADSAVPTANLGTRALSITVRAAGTLGRNDACSGATAISNGTIRASISPYHDIDVYSFDGTVGKQVTIEIFANAGRLDLDGDPTNVDSYLDSMVELLDDTCPDALLDGTNALAFSDDIDPGVVQDSLIQNFTLPYTGTYFIRVRDFRGDGRPDLIYELSLSGAN